MVAMVFKFGNRHILIENALHSFEVQLLYFDFICLNELRVFLHFDSVHAGYQTIMITASLQPTEYIMQTPNIVSQFWTQFPHPPSRKALGFQYGFCLDAGLNPL